ncbi:MAG: hypothetical protein ACOC2A_03720, partial [Halanaeroarchaeum sp.]
MGDDASDREETAGSDTPDPPRSPPSPDGDQEPPTLGSGGSERIGSGTATDPDPRAGPIDALRWLR